MSDLILKGRIVSNTGPIIVLMAIGKLSILYIITNLISKHEAGTGPGGCMMFGNHPGIAVLQGGEDVKPNKVEGIFFCR